MVVPESGLDLEVRRKRPEGLASCPHDVHLPPEPRYTTCAYWQIQELCMRSFDPEKLTARCHDGVGNEGGTLRVRSGTLRLGSCRAGGKALKRVRIGPSVAVFSLLRTLFGRPAGARECWSPEGPRRGCVGMLQA